MKGFKYILFIFVISGCNNANHSSVNTSKRDTCKVTIYGNYKICDTCETVIIGHHIESTGSAHIEVDSGVIYIPRRLILKLDTLHKIQKENSLYQCYCSMTSESLMFNDYNSFFKLWPDTTNFKDYDKYYRLKGHIADLNFYDNPKTKKRDEFCLFLFFEFDTFEYLDNRYLKKIKIIKELTTAN